MKDADYLWLQEMLKECKDDLLKEMDTGELIYEALCPVCKRVAEYIIEKDGVINCWDDMLERHHKNKQSEVQ